MRTFLENLGRRTIGGVEELGYGFALFVESLYWLVVGRFREQPVRIPSIFQEAMAIGVRAVPIVGILTFCVGAMSAIQGIETLKTRMRDLVVAIGELEPRHLRP